MTTVLCLGGPLHGHRVTPDTWPPPPVVRAAAPLTLPAIDLDPTVTVTTAEAPQDVEYTLWRRPGREPVYVTADYHFRPFVPPVIGRHLAAIYEQHGLREGEHYIVNREEP